jgi:hypothetical protein
MSEKISVIQKPMPMTITIPGEKVREFAHALETAKLILESEWEREVELNPDPKKQPKGLKSALDTLIEIREAIVQSR